MNKKENFYPKNLIEFFKNITLVNDIQNPRGYRTLHSNSFCNYGTGRHQQFSGTPETNIYPNNEMIILWCGFYPYNNSIIKRKLQIQQNIPLSDKQRGAGFQHITDNEKLVEAVDMQFHPNNEWEMEMYSEAIIYARHAVLN